MTKDEHEQALEKIEALMDKDPPVGSAEARQLKSLAIEVEKYEEGHFPIDPPTPQELAEFRADQMDIKEPLAKEWVVV